MIKVFDYDEAAALLKVKPRTLRKWVADRRVPFVRVGVRKIRFREEDLERFLERNVVDASKYMKKNPLQIVERERVAGVSQ